MEDCCCKKTRVRSEKELKSLLNRLSRVEGQVRGIRKMLEEDAYCIDVVNQTQAATSALNAFTKEILSQHIKTCVKTDVENGNEEKLDEVLATIRRLL